SVFYHEPTVRVGADSTWLIGELPRASLFHFAGHAIFDYINPDRSFLATSSGRVTARTLAAKDLSGLRLVVLSAGEATRPGGTRNAGLVGIADAFLAAGAGGVVGPNWQVADSTAAELMEAFHREYASSRSPAAALQAAQLSVIKSKRGMATSPAK